MSHRLHLPGNILEWPRSLKRLFVVALDVTMGVLAMWLAFSLRLDTLHWPEGLQWRVYAMAPLLAIPILANQGLYRAIFRYTGISALITTGKAVAIYGAVLLAILLTVQWEGVPRSVGILQPLIFLLMVGSSRALGWLWLRGRPGTAPIRLLIYGAGSAGAQTAAGLAGAHLYQLQGFIDDDTAKTGRSINGTRVYSAQDLPKLVDHLAITDVLLALPSATRQRRRQIIESLRDLPVRIRTLPGLTDLASGRVTVADFQELDIEDLLGRDPVAASPELIRQNLKGKVILVTGAGGSIGSELCRQIVRESPARLLLVDHSEYALYAIHQELQALRDQGTHTCDLIPLLASVADPRRIAEICRANRPTSIYHAAAYKHVPMVEANAGEGVLNNVFGTLNMVRMALEYGATHFVLISTDKAVRPTNVMGASKRVAELILQAIAASRQPPFAKQAKTIDGNWRCPTCFSMVRFGNVLGSSGSVIPLFRRQIAAGGPVTVTHPQVTRYFMTISEAAQLVLQAGAMAEGGDLFLLDMGEPIRIVDLARRMVALSGLTVRDEQHPGGDIAIEFTGLRPGEKLYEELLIGDHPLPTAHPRILRAREEHAPWEGMQATLEALRNAALADNTLTIKTLLRQLVPGYQPADSTQP
ncbi:polysaccharide biosynthesis protein CapD [Acidovorax delafieldii 2AN]|uniref:Polysaccharide biosynthesis protein CapD n=1 Tax=Acidovorax delafieldii 2AN TaxID=573060 RepID=C5T7Z6_ACIDE|nr:nucleoside-diphosphate sugar epimerase/dehydratase [Acidovorax delafieldii]EER59394.1 polysaccharide biosynthesis protein CapD [Acidovorax delafieldii 2AN]